MSDRTIGSISAEMVQQALADAEIAACTDLQLSKLAAYGNLLLRWNQRMNLTAVREPEGILRRHLVESVAAALALPAGVGRLLDYGSGAGLPGIPIAIVREEVRVTLAESQSKKAAFLREAVRTLDLTATVHPGRVEQMPAAESFDAVTLRAVERMPEAVVEARRRLRQEGFLVLFATQATENELLAAAAPVSFVRHRLPDIGYLMICSV